MIVILGWLSATAGLTVRLAGAALVLVLGLFIAVRHAYDVTDTTRWLLPLSLAALALIGLGLRYAESRRRTSVAHVLAVGLLFCAVFGEQVMSAVAVEDSRSQVLHALPAWGSTETGARRLVQSADDWPRSRTSAGDLATVNDPMLIGGEGGQYYSSAIPQTLSATLIRLGWGYSSYGRALVDPELPLTDALFGVTHRVVSGDGTARPESLHLIENRAAPLFHDPHRAVDLDGEPGSVRRPGDRSRCPALRRADRHRPPRNGGSSCRYTGGGVMSWPPASAAGQGRPTSR